MSSTIYFMRLYIIILQLLICSNLSTIALLISRNSLHIFTSAKTMKRQSVHHDVSRSSVTIDSRAVIQSYPWMDLMKATYDGRVVTLREWNDEEWRKDPNGGGFSGTDFCHSKSSAVQIQEYLLLDKSNSHLLSKFCELEYPFLIGAAFFSAECESHRGLCHGGTFCALMDDAIGWMGFCFTGEVRPWCGYTVQVNTALKKAVKIGSTLKLESWVTRREGTRKVWISSRLVDPESGDVHCEGEGLFLLSPEEVDKTIP
jgi:hypothetical protein